jgi:hypothetical protein
MTASFLVIRMLLAPFVVADRTGRLDNESAGRGRGSTTVAAEVT